MAIGRLHEAQTFLRHNPDQRELFKAINQLISGPNRGSYPNNSWISPEGEGLYVRMFDSRQDIGFHAQHGVGIPLGDFNLRELFGEGEVDGLHFVFHQTEQDFEDSDLNSNCLIWAGRNAPPPAVRSHIRTRFITALSEHFDELLKSFGRTFSQFRTEMTPEQQRSGLAHTSSVLRTFSAPAFTQKKRSNP